MSGLHDASWIERAIREAQERGEFDNLPGAGKPLREIDTNDPNWWLRQYAEREQLDLSQALPPALLLRKEAASYPDALAEIADEARVREVLASYNKRARAEVMRPVVGPRTPVPVKYLDVEEMVSQWRELRAARPAAESGPMPPATLTSDGEPAPGRQARGGPRRGLRRWLRRS